LVDLIATVETDLIAISPYFVPGKKGADFLRAMAERGVRVTILTNSLAATDVPAVHAGYARYRRTLVEAGVELYEMRPSPLAQQRDSYRLGESQASLHSKTLVFDRERVLVGSMNLDPRSHLLNTEMGILIDNPELAGMVANWREKTLPDIAWRLDLETVAASYVPPGQEQRLVWIGREGGREVRLHESDPEAGIWARLQAFVLSLLPIERQL
jgi:putative cardiolipin synthase